MLQAKAFRQWKLNFLFAAKIEYNRIEWRMKVIINVPKAFRETRICTSLCICVNYSENSLKEDKLLH